MESNFASRDADARVGVGEGIVDTPDNSIPVFKGHMPPRHVEGDEDLPSRGALHCVVQGSPPVWPPSPTNGAKRVVRRSSHLGHPAAQLRAGQLGHQLG